MHTCTVLSGSSGTERCYGDVGEVWLLYLWVSLDGATEELGGEGGMEGYVLCTLKYGVPIANTITANHKAYLLCPPSLPPYTSHPHTY